MVVILDCQINLGPNFVAISLEMIQRILDCLVNRLLYVTTNLVNLVDATDSLQKNLLIFFPNVMAFYSLHNSQSESKNVYY